MGDWGKGWFREVGKEGMAGDGVSMKGEAETAGAYCDGMWGIGSRKETGKGQERDREAESEHKGDQAVVGAVPKALGGTVLEGRRHWLHAARTDGLTQDNRAGVGAAPCLVYQIAGGAAVKRAEWGGGHLRTHVRLGTTETSGGKSTE